MVDDPANSRAPVVLVRAKYVIAERQPHSVLAWGGMPIGQLIGQIPYARIVGNLERGEKEAPCTFPVIDDNLSGRQEATFQRLLANAPHASILVVTDLQYRTLVYQTTYRDM